MSDLPESHNSEVVELDLNPETLVPGLAVVEMMPEACESRGMQLIVCVFRAKCM